jgi:hypothetical protein
MSAIDYVPELLEWYEIYRFDDRLEQWVKWTSVDVQRLRNGRKVLDNQILYCRQSYPNQPLRIIKVNRTIVSDESINS